MRRSTAVSLSITTGVALALTGCGSSVPKDSYQAVCVDKTTNQRIDDSRCNPNGSGGFGGNDAFLWYYLAMNRSYAPVGGYVSGGSYDVPRSGNYVRGGASTTGGKVTADSLTKASSVKGASSYSGGSKSSSISRGGLGGSGKGSGG